MNKVLIAAVSAVVIAGGSFYAVAERADNHEKYGKKGMMSHMDSNNDGNVSKAEFLENAQKRFEETDANKDGNVTAEEMKAHHKAQKEKRKKMKEEMKEERKAKQDEHFNKMDTNGDGSISKEEMRSFKGHKMRKGHDKEEE
ncbi:EF-hand domain-containing protein [Rickettsiales bacterium]|nr:EF-hand domain-containing protein [Rickettsiales bacterium]